MRVFTNFKKIISLLSIVVFVLVTTVAGFSISIPHRPTTVTTIVKVDDSNSAISYTGNWLLSPSTSFYKNSAKYTNNINDSASFTFTGTEITWIARKNINRGKATVYIDGVSQGIVSLYARQILNQQKIFTKTGLTNIKHTIKIVALDVKRTEIDAFIYKKVSQRVTPTQKPKPTPTPTIAPIPTMKPAPIEPTPTPTIAPIPTMKPAPIEPTPTPTIAPIPTMKPAPIEPTPTPTIAPTTAPTTAPTPTIDPNKPKVKYVLNKSNSPSQEELVAYDLITKAMDSAVDYYNRYGAFDKTLNVNYNPGVGTADGNPNGTINFGSNTSYMVTCTAMHEIAHTLGIGYWGGLEVNGVFTGQNATNMLRQLTGDSNAVVGAGGSHFWPYGLNYDNEDSEQARVNHVKMVTAIKQDMGW